MKTNVKLFFRFCGILILLCLLFIVVKTELDSGLVVRTKHTATLLKDGRVLIVGGRYTAFPSSTVQLLAELGLDFQQYRDLTECELYNPDTGLFTKTGDLHFPRHGHVASLLSNGLVVVGGGLIGSELYDPSTGTWTLISVKDVVSPEAAVLLPDGDVLFISAYANGGPSSVIYSPQSNTWKARRSLHFARTNETSTQLRSGDIFVVGGSDKKIPSEIFRNSDKSWIESVTPVHSYYVHLACLLKTGNVLIVGGYDKPMSYRSTMSYRYCELFNPTTGAISPTGDLISDHQRGAATLLIDGRVLVTGGLDNPDDWFDEKAKNDCELYDPATGKWTKTGSLRAARGYHKATLLQSGKVLVTGGEFANQAPLAENELYDPATGTWTELP